MGGNHYATIVRSPKVGKWNLNSDSECQSKPVPTPRISFQIASAPPNNSIYNSCKTKEDISLEECDTTSKGPKLYMKKFKELKVISANVKFALY